MSAGDKAQHKAEELGGKAKEWAGKATGNEELTEEGKTEQAKAGVKGAVEDVKDAVGDAAQKVQDKFKK
ncbi:CsbD-like protein [Tamaricihabitans halophyticus]|uniref:CsbD-like protein n=1 Tax=Tamaricihabitans halophyticus TaxID=1262583 RepID=A0A4R2R598_9PSEU|nr:CsbD family protein [Tamaricihabitans halophyticus]TCP56918.1 CsbD-like protein [Tamaricihabitans halophyticus]